MPKVRHPAEIAAFHACLLERAASCGMICAARETVDAVFDLHDRCDLFCAAC